VPFTTYYTDAATRCIILDSTGATSFLFTTVALSATGIIVTPKKDVVAAIYKVKCLGGAAPDGTGTGTFDLYTKRISDSTTI
jgi:hypothetical protein